MFEALKIFQALASKHGVEILARHISGIENLIADRLSRTDNYRAFAQARKGFQRLEKIPIVDYMNL